MANIALGQKISGSISSTDTLTKDGFQYYDDYDLPSLAGFSQLDIKLDFPLGVPVNSSKIELINTATDAIIASSLNSTSKTSLSLAQTTLPGVNYKLRVTSGDSDSKSTSNPGTVNYQLSVTDGGKGTSLVALPRGSDSFSAVGTVGQSGAYFSLGSYYSIGSLEFGMEDVVKTTNGQFYGFRTDRGLSSPTSDSSLYLIDPSLAVEKQTKSIPLNKDANGKNIVFSAIESTADNKLYGLGTTEVLGSIKLYQIDVTTDKAAATLLGTLPTEFLSVGDMVLDAANNRFLATGMVTPGIDALWQIPLNNPAGASQIGSTGFSRVDGLNFEGGQLFGYTPNSSANNESNRLKIDIASGKGTLDGVITTKPFASVAGAGTIVGGSTPTTPTTPVIPITTITTTPVVPTFPTSAVDAIGTKNQSLTQRTIDLTNHAGIALKVDTVTKGDAAYNNNIGFYAVQDSIGTIKLGNGSTLKPGDANYAVEAVKSAVLRAAKIDSKLNQNITGGGIYAPVVVAQGSLDDFVNKNPTNGGGGNEIHAYFNYIGANTDKFDHFRLTAPNTFAVEDMYGGGDKDYNDLVVNMNVKAA
jgi:hypothetical protein